MTDKKTAEEILDKHIAIKLEAFPDIVPAMHEYAAQELAEYKAMIEELLPIAEDGLYAVPVKSLEGVREVIDRARKLIDKL